MNTLGLILTGLGAMIMLTIFILLRKKPKGESLPKPLDLRERANWTNEELGFMSDLNLYRHGLGLSLIRTDDKMKKLSQGRVKMWIKDKVLINNLHNGFPYHAKPYFSQGYIELNELAQAGYTGSSILQKYQLSNKHNPTLIDPAIKSGAITIRKNHLDRNRTCLILTK